jgi:hypothetical protein
MTDDARRAEDIGRVAEAEKRIRYSHQAKLDRLEATIRQVEQEMREWLRVYYNDNVLRWYELLGGAVDKESK